MDNALNIQISSTIHRWRSVKLWLTFGEEKVAFREIVVFFFNFDVLNKFYHLFRIIY